jgi:hypothetical protein
MPINTNVHKKKRKEYLYLLDFIVTLKTIFYQGEGGNKRGRGGGGIEGG